MKGEANLTFQENERARRAGCHSFVTLGQKSRY